VRCTVILALSKDVYQILGEVQSMNVYLNINDLFNLTALFIPRTPFKPFLAQRTAEMYCNFVTFQECISYSGTSTVHQCIS
jgi:hypothetical protein